MIELNITIQGRKPVLLHNGRLSNPLDPYTRKLKEKTSKRKKTDDDLQEIAMIEARAGMYDAPGDLMGIPNANVFRSILDSAKLDKLGKLLSQSFSFDDIVEPLLINRKTIKCDDYLTMEGSLDYRSVKVGMSRVMRARAKVYPDWQSTHSFMLDEAILDLHLLEPVIERAGLRFGVGDWRPIYGTFDAFVEVAE